MSRLLQEDKSIYRRVCKIKYLAQSLQLKSYTWKKKSFPSAERIAAFPIDNGIAPSKTPWGQIYLQKNGSPIPIEFVISIGRSITKTIRMTYFRYLRGFNLAVDNFFPGILWSKSWNHPNGHKKPHINLPRVTPSKIKIRLCSMKT